MINATQILSKVNQTAVKEVTTNGIVSYFKGFMTNPLLIGGISLGIVLVVIVCLKQFTDNSETRVQLLFWSFLIHFGVFIVVLVGLFMLDAGGIAVLGGVLG